MDACFKASQETYAEESAKNPQFKKIFEDYRAFRNMEAQWFGLAEQAFAQYSFSKKLWSIYFFGEIKRAPKSPFYLFSFKF